MDQARTGLRALALNPLPLGSIRATGWLERQLPIQVDGLSGHLDQFWPDVAQSGWIGGTAEGWERGPSWLDGVIPLAFLLDDLALKAKVNRWVNEIVARQRDDGWLGPIQSDSQSIKYPEHDPWPTFVALKALTQYCDATGDTRVMVAIERNLRCIATLLAQKPLFVWGKSRWADLVLSTHWLYDRTGASWLLNLAALVHAQGYDWRAHFANFQSKGKVPPEKAPPLPAKLVAGAMIPRWQRAEIEVNALRTGDRSLLLLMLLADQRTRSLEQAEGLIDAWLADPRNEAMAQVFEK